MDLDFKEKKDPKAGEPLSGQTQPPQEEKPASLAEKTPDKALGNQARKATTPPENSPEGGEGGEGGEGADLNTLLLGDKALQSQFDKAITKAIATAHQKWEAQKNMTAEQLAQTKAQEWEAALLAREAALQERERRAMAIGLLAKRGLPPELIACVGLGDDAAMAASIGAAEAAFRQAVNQAVEQRMRGLAPKAAEGSAVEAAQLNAAFGL